jgi:hydroxyacylglutathione hydrolase
MAQSTDTSPITIECLSLGALETNCYIVWCTQTLQAFVIDPADSGEVISSSIVEKGLELQAIILTHGHFDHVLGLLEVKLNFNVPIYLHPADTGLLAQAQASAHHWLKRRVDPVPAAEVALAEGQRHPLGTTSLTVIETPGHTPGSVCLYNDQVIFTGDTLFKGTIGRTDFSYSNPQHMVRSLHRLHQLPSHLQVFPGHGSSTTLSAEKSVLNDIF